MTKYFYRLIFLLATVIPAGTYAQNFSGHNWYFGNQGIRFSRGDNSVSLITNRYTGAFDTGAGGTAVVSDPYTGTLLFYTDGVNVIDASHQIAPGGPLGGINTRNQSVTVCKNPSFAGEYYIFYSVLGGGIQYAVFDSTQVGNGTTFGQPPLGALTDVNNNITGLPTGLSEGMIMLPDPNSDGYWLVTHASASPTYHFVKIDNSGVNYIGNVTAGTINNAVNFSYHPATRTLGVSPGEAGRSVELATITFPPAPVFPAPQTLPTLAVMSVPNSASATANGIFDTEFSSSGRYFYVSRTTGGAGDVMQYDLNPTATPPPAPASVLTATAPTASLGLQMGPDSVLYYLYASGGNVLLGGFTNTDTIAAEVDYDASIFAGNFGARQFPSFAPFDKVNWSLDFTNDGTCANSNISFFPEVKPQADSLVWTFGDGGTSSEWSPVYNYPDEGNYTVKLKAYLNGQVDSVEKPLNIVAFDAQISLVQDTTACSCELPFPKANPIPTPPGACSRFTLTAQINAGNGPTPTWQWYGPAGPIGSPSSGTTATLQPDSAGYYFLVATVGSCQTSAGVNIKEYNVQDQRANIWYFGNRAGIDFNPVFDNPPGSPVAITNERMDALEGTSTISDRNGQVLFFTDGNTVWNRQEDEVATDIGGTTGNSSQAALIIPVPGDETLYYIFTTEEIPGTGTYRLAYSLYDVKMDFPKGGLRARNVTLFTRSTERITGNENWLIAHEYGNNTFRAYRITDAGIANPIFSSIGSDHNIAFPANAEGYMRLGPQGRLAVPISTPGVSNIVEVFDFVDSAGTVTNLRTVNLKSTTGQAYGVEFGAGGNKMYVSLLGSPSSKLYEYAFDTLGIPHQPSATPRMSDATYPQGLGAIVMGPDQQIYVAVKDQPALGVITVVADTTRASTFQIDAFPLMGGQSRLGLPNFIQIISDAPQGPSIAHTGECLGSPTNFTGSGTDPIDVLTWAFGDGGGESGVNLTDVEHTYATAGTYFVTLSISNRCVGLIEILRDTVVINPLPPDPSTSLSLCTPPLVLDANPTNTPGLEYLWQDGQTTETISISQARTYFVTVTSTATQCSVDGAIRVNPALVTINLGPDVVACSAPNTGQTLNTGINIQKHSWSLNGVDLGNTGPTQPADFTTPGTFTYIVEYRDAPSPPGTGCFTRDTLTVTVNQSPTVTMNAGPAIGCAAANGTLVGISVAQSTNYFYSFTGPTAIPNGTSPIPVSFGGLAAGTYTLTVNDQASGCPAGATATINATGQPTLALVVQPACAATPQPVAIQILGAGTFATTDTYTILNANTGAVVETGNVPTAGTSFQSDPLAPGIYNVTVYFGGAPPVGCPSGTTIQLNQGSVIANAGIDITGICGPATPSVTAIPNNPAFTYTWSSTPAGLTGSGPTVQIPASMSGAYTLSVLIDDGAGGADCPTNASINVVINPTFTASIDYAPCFDPVTLNGFVNGAQPANYFYAWTGPVNGTSMQLVTGVRGDYTLTVQNPSSGCSATAMETIVPLGPLAVQIKPPTNPPCDNAPFALTAVLIPPDRNITNVYQWSLNGTDISSPTTAELGGQRAAGLYGVEVTDGQCDASAELQIFLAPSTPSLMQDNFVICPDDNAPPAVQKALLDPGPGFTSYDWYRLVGTSESSENFFDQIFEATEVGSYRVRLENAFGCETSDDAIVEENCDPVINAPNAFRPSSGLNANQMFGIFTFYVSEDDFQIYIFNRWGEMVFESDNLAFAWNGGYKNNAGQLMPAGTYSYVLKYKSKEENAATREQRGGVLLLR